IDVTSVNSNTVFLVNLGDTLTLAGVGHKVGINQLLWDPATQTLVFESDELLAEHSRYLLVVTDGVRDASGKPIVPGHFDGVAAIQFNRQIGTAPTFSASFLPTPALNVVPGSVAQIAYGKFHSPDYETAAKYIPATPTLSGHPAVQGTNELTFQLFIPAGAKPAGGWPVAIFGHGFGDSMYGAPWTVASVFASQGIATLTINVVGHGG